MSKKKPRCRHGKKFPCKECRAELVDAIDWGKPGRPEDRILERDDNANSDLLRARTARFSVNKEPATPPPRNGGERK